MYRQVQATLGTMDELRAHLRTAALASDTRTVSAEANAGLALLDRALDVLKTARGDEKEEYGKSVNHQLVEAGIAALSDAWEQAEKVALANGLEEMRGRVLDFKTSVDQADAYLGAAVGWEEA